MQAQVEFNVKVVCHVEKLTKEISGIDEIQYVAGQRKISYGLEDFSQEPQCGDEI